MIVGSIAFNLTALKSFNFVEDLSVIDKNFVENLNNAFLQYLYIHMYVLHGSAGLNN